MKKYKVFWKNEPYIEVEKEEDLEDEKISIFTEISMNIWDYLDFEEVKEEIKPNPIKKQIQELIKVNDKDEGISENDIYNKIKMCACNEKVTFEEVKEIINDLLVEGWAYECRPNIIRYLG